MVFSSSLFLFCLMISSICIQSCRALSSSSLLHKNSESFFYNSVRKHKETNNVVLWFRDHALRIHDNLALVNAIRDNIPHDHTCRLSLTPVFLWSATCSNAATNTNCPDTKRKGACWSAVNEKTGGTAKDVFVVNALHGLNATLNGSLLVGIVDSIQHDAARELVGICKTVNASKVYYLKSHNEMEESKLEMKLKEQGIVPVSFGGSFSLIDYTHHTVPWKDIVLEHPWRSPLIPFVDYVKRIMDETPKQVCDVPREFFDRHLVELSGHELSSSIVSKPCAIDDLKMTVGRTLGGTNWGKSLSAAWPATEEDAANALSCFLASVKDEETLGKRDDTAAFAKRTHLASRLSPYLARGLISPGQVYHGIKDLGDDYDVDSFLRRICWRDYTYAAVQLYPKVLRGEPIRDGYEELRDGIPMVEGERQRRLKCWKEGKTGFPLIDAGMRQLAKVGWMPQKVRLACSTFLVEGLGLSWKDGMQHFAYYLVDFDESINSNMWQNAGCVGLDPYYVGMNYKRRMYWDSTGHYVRTWCPELGLLPDSVEIESGKTSKLVDCLYEPWMSPENILERAGVDLGKTYPLRVCNDRETRSTFFSRVRDVRLNWPATRIDAQKRDLVHLGSAGYVGLFTPRALQIRESASVFSS